MKGRNCPWQRHFSPAFSSFSHMRSEAFVSMHCLPIHSEEESAKETKGGRENSAKSKEESKFIFVILLRVSFCILTNVTY